MDAKTFEEFLAMLKNYNADYDKKPVYDILDLLNWGQPESKWFTAKKFRNKISRVVEWLKKLRYSHSGQF
jgi:hypothetical protein